MAQGVKNNLANLLTVIPKTTNLATDSSGVIYDTTSPDTDLNGQASLPYGGYLGVGFLSNFDYDFYSPAPARSGNSYQYSQGVRYDLFGSALQAHLTTQVRDIVYLNYYDADENNQLIVPPTSIYLVSKCFLECSSKHFSSLSIRLAKSKDYRKYYSCRRLLPYSKYSHLCLLRHRWHLSRSRINQWIL